MINEQFIHHNQKNKPIFFSLFTGDKGRANKVNQKGASCYTISQYRNLLMLNINNILKISKYYRQYQYFYKI